MGFEYSEVEVRPKVVARDTKGTTYTWSNEMSVTEVVARGPDTSRGLKMQTCQWNLGIQIQVRASMLAIYSSESMKYIPYEYELMAPVCN